MPTFLLALAACLALAAPAAAAPLRVHFTGTVTFDDARDWEEGSGERYGPSLVGETWTGHYDYDPELPTVPFNRPPGSGLLLGLSFEVGSFAWSIDAAELDQLGEPFFSRYGAPSGASLVTANLTTIGNVNGEYFTDVLVGPSSIRVLSEFRIVGSVPNSQFLVASLDSLSEPQPIPEPGTLVLLGLGLLGVATQRRFSAASQ